MGEAFTDNIPDILIKAGFDTKTALKSMNSQNITLIENFINENKENCQKILEGTKYENTEIFKFLPGHCALLLSLPEYVQSLNSKNVRGKKRKHCETLDHPQSSNADHPSVDGVEIDDNIKIQIKQQLIKKINNFATNKKLSVKIDENNISNFRFENKSWKCSVRCSACTKIVPCTYVTHWICGNFETHLKKHPNQHFVEEFEVQEDNTLRPIGEIASTAITRIGNHKGLQQILNSK